MNLCAKFMTTKNKAGDRNRLSVDHQRLNTFSRLYRPVRIIYLAALFCLCVFGFAHPAHALDVQTVGYSNYPDANNACKSAYQAALSLVGPGQVSACQVLEPPQLVQDYGFIVDPIIRMSWTDPLEAHVRFYWWSNPEICPAGVPRDPNTGSCAPAPPPPDKDAGGPDPDGGPEPDPGTGPEPDPGSDPNTDPGPAPGPSPLPCDSDKMTGYPCNTATGNKYLRQVD